MMDDRIDNLIAADNDDDSSGEESVPPKRPESLWNDIDVPKRKIESETDYVGGKPYQS